MRLALHPAFGKLKENSTKEVKEPVCGHDSDPQHNPANHSL